MCSGGVSVDFLGLSSSGDLEGSEFLKLEVKRILKIRWRGRLGMQPSVRAFGVPGVPIYLFIKDILWDPSQFPVF